MKRLILLCICVAACRHPQAATSPYPAVAAPCSDARVGKVRIVGGDREDVPQLAVLEGTLDNEARTDRIAGVSAAQLRDRGYPRAAVTVTREQGCGVELVVSVDKGEKFRIGSIVFDTTDELPAKQRLAALEDALGTVNSVGGAYVADRLTRALDHLTQRYHELGWLQAEIAQPHATFDDARGEVHLKIAVRAGTRFRIGNVVVSGGRRRTRAAVIEALGLRGGQWYDAGRLREGLVRARREVDDRLEMRMEQVDANTINLEAVVGEDER